VAERSERRTTRGFIVTDRTIDVHLTALRHKLGPASDGLETVRGVGYRLVPEDERGEEPE
jgi:DNA-binding response OmpR family regulator